MAQEGNYGVVAWGKLLVFDIDIYGDGEQGVISRAHVNPTYIDWDSRRVSADRPFVTT